MSIEKNNNLQKLPKVIEFCDSDFEKIFANLEIYTLESFLELSPNIFFYLSNPAIAKEAFDFFKVKIDETTYQIKVLDKSRQLEGNLNNLGLIINTYKSKNYNSQEEQTNLTNNLDYLCHLYLLLRVNNLTDIPVFLEINKFLQNNGNWLADLNIIQESNLLSEFSSVFAEFISPESEKIEVPPEESIDNFDKMSLVFKVPETNHPNTEENLVIQNLLKFKKSIYTILEKINENQQKLSALEKKLEKLGGICKLISRPEFLQATQKQKENFLKQNTTKKEELERQINKIKNLIKKLKNNLYGKLKELKKIYENLPDKIYAEILNSYPINKETFVITELETNGIFSKENLQFSDILNSLIAKSDPVYRNRGNTQEVISAFFVANPAYSAAKVLDYLMQYLNNSRQIDFDLIQKTLRILEEFEIICTFYDNLKKAKKVENDNKKTIAQINNSEKKLEEQIIKQKPVILENVANLIDNKDSLANALIKNIKQKVWNLDLFQIGSFLEDVKTLAKLPKESIEIVFDNLTKSINLNLNEPIFSQNVLKNLGFDLSSSEFQNFEYHPLIKSFFLALDEIVNAKFAEYHRQQLTILCSDKPSLAKLQELIFLDIQFYNQNIDFLTKSYQELEDNLNRLEEEICLEFNRKFHKIKLELPKHIKFKNNYFWKFILERLGWLNSDNSNLNLKKILSNNLQPQENLEYPQQQIQINPEIYQNSALLREITEIKINNSKLEDKKGIINSLPKEISKKLWFNWLNTKVNLTEVDYKQTIYGESTTVYIPIGYTIKAVFFSSVPINGNKEKIIQYDNKSKEYISKNFKLVGTNQQITALVVNFKKPVNINLVLEPIKDFNSGGNLLVQNIDKKTEFKKKLPDLKILETEILSVFITSKIEITEEILKNLTNFIKFLTELRLEIEKKTRNKNQSFIPNKEELTFILEKIRNYFIDEFEVIYNLKTTTGSLTYYDNLSHTIVSLACLLKNKKGKCDIFSEILALILKSVGLEKIYVVSGYIPTQKKQTFDLNLPGHSQVLVTYREENGAIKNTTLEATKLATNSTSTFNGGINRPNDFDNSIKVKQKKNNEIITKIQLTFKEIKNDKDFQKIFNIKNIILCFLASISLGTFTATYDLIFDYLKESLSPKIEQVIEDKKNKELIFKVMIILAISKLGYEGFRFLINQAQLQKLKLQNQPNDKKVEEIDENNPNKTSSSNEQNQSELITKSKEVTPKIENYIEGILEAEKPKEVVFKTETYPKEIKTESDAEPKNQKNELDLRDLKQYILINCDLFFINFLDSVLFSSRKEVNLAYFICDEKGKILTTENILSLNDNQIIEYFLPIFIKQGILKEKVQISLKKLFYNKNQENTKNYLTLQNLKELSTSQQVILAFYIKVFEIIYAFLKNQKDQIYKQYQFIDLDEDLKNLDQNITLLKKNFFLYNF